MKVFISEQQFGRDQLHSLPRSYQSRSWGGAILNSPLQWIVACDPERLWFVCCVPGEATFNPEHLAGAFVEGLWEYDVAELFLIDARGRYQEFNVSPTGAWWSCGFESYRKRISPNQTPQGLRVESVIRHEAWEVILSVPLSELIIPLNELVGGHVSAISRAPVTRYLSSQPVHGIDPDFHDHRCFAALERIELPSYRVSS